MTIKIFKIDELEFNNINFLKPNKNKHDIIIPLYYKIKQTNNFNKPDKMPLLVQIPSLYLNDSYSNNTLMLPLVGKNENSTEDICNFFNGLDTYIMKNLKKILLDIKRDNEYSNINFNNISYKSIVNEIEDNDDDIYKNGLIRYKINTSNMTNTKIYDDKKMLISEQNYITKLKKGTYVKSIIEINSLVLRDNVIHVYIKPHQLRISTEKMQSVRLEDYSFIDSDCEENNDSEIILNTQTDYLENKNNVESEYNVMKKMINEPNIIGEKNDQINYYEENNSQLDTSDNDSLDSILQSETNEIDAKNYFDNL